VGLFGTVHAAPFIVGMLASYLEGHKQELLRRIESRAAADEGPEAAKGRRERIGVLVEDLIEAVRHGDGSQTQVASDARDAALQCRERDLVRLDVIKEVGRHSLEVTLDEMATVSEWASAADRSRLGEGYSRLSDLLDDMDEVAVIVSAEGRIDYLNRRFARELCEATGVPQDQLVGKTFEPGRERAPARGAREARARIARLRRGGPAEGQERGNTDPVGPDAGPLRTVFTRYPGHVPAGPRSRPLHRQAGRTRPRRHHRRRVEYRGRYFVHAALAARAG
jgi:hypothetical protein